MWAGSCQDTVSTCTVYLCVLIPEVLSAPPVLSLFGHVRDEIDTCHEAKRAEACWICSDLKRLSSNFVFRADNYYNPPVTHCIPTVCLMKTYSPRAKSLS